MAHSITLSPDNKYIILTVKGEITRGLAIAQNIEAHALGKKLGIHCYLVDLTQARNVDTITNNYIFAYKDMQTSPNIDRSARLAMLVSQTDHSHDFVETALRNAGLNATLFRNRQIAMRYLLEETQKSVE